MAKFQRSSLLSLIFKNYGYLFLTTGILLILFSVSYRTYRSRVLSFKGTVTESVIKQYVKPVRIVIDDLKIDLPIEEGSIQDGIWSISENGASHLNISESPGGKGNIVIYAHNKNKLFGPIRWIKNDTLIKVINEDGKEYDYKVTERIEVKPTDLTYVLPKNEETLTLYTCSGFADSKRFIVTAKRV
jgi:LPXTG-site transpeptidase (sortase) family protein